jgi:tetratricopeptide (TPR) repeat protein
MTPAFVGREKEMALLRVRLDSALAGRGSVVFLSADAGGGKSTLVGHFFSEARQAHPDALVIQAGCSEQFGAGEPYQPFVEAFRHLASERDGRKGRSFKEMARELAPVWLAAIPVAGEVIAASLSTAAELRQTFASGGGQKNAAASEEALFFQYTELFFAAAAEQPVLIFIDDLHWADHATVSLLAHLGRRVGDQRVMMLGSYRPVDVDVADHPMRQARQELERYRVAEELVLEPLGSAALRDLVLLREGLPPSRQLLDWLERRAGTNALFFEELLGWLVARGLAAEVRGELHLARVPEEIEIPRTAESTIEKRLDRLDDHTRRVLEYASVQGNEFDSVGLARLLDMDELDLEETLEPIARLHRLIALRETRDLPDGDFASVYSFSHSLVQDVLHGSLQGKRRILLHRKMALILEEQYGADAAVVAGRLAVHFEEGRQGGKASDYALLAAGRASSLYAHWDALEHLQRALRNAESDEQRAEAFRHLGEEYLSMGRYAEALEAFDQALVRVAGDPQRALQVRHQRILAERNQGVRPVEEILQEMKALRAEAHALGAGAQECRILWHLIDLPGTTESADVALAREALTLAQEVGDPWLRARGHEMYGVSLAFAGRPAEGAPELQRALELYHEVDDRGQEASCRNHLALAHVFMRQTEAAAAEFEAAARVFSEIVDPVRSAAVRTNLGALLRMLGQYDRAESMLVEAVDIAQRLDAPVRLLSPLQNLADVHESREEWGAAERCWRELLARAQETGYRGEQVIAYCGIGTVCLRRGDYAGAEEAEREARALLGEPLSAAGESGEALLLLSARLAAAAGEVDGAVALLTELEGQVAGRDAYMAALTQLERARILAPTDPRKASALAEEAHQGFAELGAVLMMDMARTCIEELGGAGEKQAAAS